MTMPMMIFAAGLGTRMGDLVRDRPKPLVQIGKTTLIDHAMSFIDRQRIGPIVVNLHYKSQMLRDHLDGHDVVFSDETEKLMETGGGLKQALPLLSADTVMTMNSDAVWQGPNPISAVLGAWDPDRMDALLLLASQKRARGHRGAGDFIIAEDGSLDRGPGAIYTGVQVIKTDGLSAMPDDPFSMNLYWDAIAKHNRLFGTVYDGNWCDVGHPQSLPIAEEMLSGHV